MLLAAAALVVSLVQQIDRMAASEPVVYGIDTRIRAAEVLAPSWAAIAIRELHDAEAALGGVADPDSRDTFQIRILKALAPIDFTEAERVARSIEPERTHDRLAEAWSHLCERSRSRDCVDMLLTALHSGAFRLHFDSRQFGPQQNLRIFAGVVDAFPASSTDAADIEYLLRRAREFRELNRELTLVAVRKAVAAADEQPAAARPRLRFQIAELLRAIGTDLPVEFVPLLDAPRPAEKTPEKDSSGDEIPDFGNLPYAEALQRALGIENPMVRAAVLINLSRREDLTPKQQATVAGEALTAANRMPLGEERLYGLSMLSRDFVKRQDLAKAALAAQMLSDSFGKVCGCEAAVCKSAGEPVECLSLVNEYAEYLDELNLSQESLGLNNLSLDVRLRVLKLRKLAGAK